MTTSASAALIVRYSFDETDNTVNPQVVDSVGPTFTNGGQNGGVDLDVDGVFGSGASFDGDNDVAFAGNSSGSEFKTSSDFTFTTWINLQPDSSPDVQARIFDATNTPDAISGGLGWRLQLLNQNPSNAGTIQLQARGGGTAINSTLSTLQEVQSDGSWTFVALRYDTDGDATVSVLYQADDPTAAAVAANSQSVSAVGPLSYGAAAVPRIAANQNAVKRTAALYDEITLWDTVLTDEELATVFRATQVPEPASASLVFGAAALLVAGRRQCVGRRQRRRDA
ncbi:MAG: LamG-like jellyroll fold domain-containing protein [Planctomycetota bacterium]